MTCTIIKAEFISFLHDQDNIQLQYALKCQNQNVQTHFDFVDDNNKPLINW